MIGRAKFIKRIGSSLLAGFLVVSPILRAQTDSGLRQTVTTLVANELRAAKHRDPFLYTSDERSDRTRGHLWTERVAETPQGKLRYLIAEDGKPLSPARHQIELIRLKSISDNPADFISREQARKNDEEHAQQMLQLLPRAFVFDNPIHDGAYVRINYHPDPAYIPQTFEERVLHGMSGIILIDLHSQRLCHLEGHLSADVSFGFGLLATIHDGSHFATTREQIAPDQWKTTLMDTHIDGRAILFKTISRNQRSEYRDFRPLPVNLSIPQAIDLLER